MKRLISTMIVSLTLISGTSQANPNHHHYHRGHHHGAHRVDWIAPFVIGGVVTYALTRPQPVIVQTPQPVYPSSVPPAPYGFRYETILDANCNCYRLVLVSN